ncbi:uncharacterized protein [Prorops nasuta]|uniref:uncharacterized protein n=1 Tax=Prorops nasuta TaxID=863751 RepID=UPI0034CD4826
MDASLKLLTFFVVSTYYNVYGFPLESNEIYDSLLPDQPKTVNETIEVVVQDPIIKNAVQHAVEDNKTLSELVIKKKTVISPVDDLDKVLSEQTQIIKVPETHLEDLRKNLTYESEVEVEESQLIVTLNEAEVPEEHGEKKRENDVFPMDPTASKTSTDESLLTETITQKLSDIIGLEPALSIKVPVVAVLDPSKEADDRARNSIIALLSLPISSTTKTTQNQLSYDEVSAVPEEDFDSSDTIGYLSAENMIISSLRVPTTEIHRVSIRGAKDLNNFQDLDVAEDMVFRPLFRFRQEAERKSNYYSEYSRRQYNPYYRRRPHYYNDDYA